MCEYCENGDSEIMQGNRYNILGRTFLLAYMSERVREI